VSATIVRLSQVIAVEKQTKQKFNREGGDLHKLNQKAELFNGLQKVYEKKDEDGEDLPGEQKLVQQNAADNLAAYADLWRELLDTVATKDWGNADAYADLIVGDEVIVERAPVTYLLWLEKQLDDIKTVIAALPTLDPSEKWTYDPNIRQHATAPVKTARQKVVKRPLVKAAATEKHAAQVDLVDEQVITGYWSLTKFSGAMTAEEKRRYLDRAEQLRKAVKFAREEANSGRVERRQVADKIVGWLLRPTT